MQKQYIFDITHTGVVNSSFKILKLHVLLNNVEVKLTVVTLNRIHSHRYKYSSSKIEYVFYVCMFSCGLNGVPEYVEIMLINHY